MTTLSLYRGVPRSYGSPHIKYTTNKQSYLSAFKKFDIANCNIGQFNNIVIPKTLLEVNDCNYASFSSGGETYYCFITNATYNNENATTLSLTPDYLFMYMDEITWGKCLIERHNYAYDSTNKIRTNEGFNPHLDVYDTYYPFTFSQYDDSIPLLFTNISMATGKVETTPPITIGASDNIMNSYHCYAVTNMSDACRFLAQVDNPENADQFKYLPEHILGIVNVPKYFVSSLLGAEVNGFSYVPMTQLDGTFTIPQKTATFGGYTPTNNKLNYSPEFHYIEMCDGFANKIKFDVSKMDSYSFKWTCVPSLDFTVHVVPVRYNGEDYPEEYAIDICNFPQGTWNTDTFKNFLLNNRNQIETTQAWSTAKMVTGVTTSALSTVGAVATGNVGGLVGGLSGISNSLLSGANDIANIEAKIKDASHMPVQIKGAVNSVTSYLARKYIDHKFRFIWFNYCCCNRNDAEAIDDFFTHYGYKFNREETPSPTHRTTYTYYKLLECNYTCKCNAEARQYIDNLLLNGLTFWNGSEVYNY